MMQTDLLPQNHRHTKPSLQSTKSKPQLKKHVNSVVSRKNAKRKSYGTRRSGRIRNTSISSQNRSSEPNIEEITLSESEDEKEEEEPPAKVEKVVAVATTNGLEQKIDYLVQLLEAKTLETLKHEANENPSCTKNPYPSDVTYKSMYVDSQKKIEELNEVIRQLTQKLDNVLCKVEVKTALQIRVGLFPHSPPKHLLSGSKKIQTSEYLYERCTRDSLEMLGKLKDLVLVLSLGKVPETAMEVQSEAVHDAVPPSEPETCGLKIKKQTKRRERN